MIKIIVLCLFIFSFNANATCYHDGVAYKTGAVLGQYVCVANGTWQKK